MSALTTALAAQSHFVTPLEAAVYLGLAVDTLRWRRATGIDCPPYWKTRDSDKAAVRYRYDEIDLWLAGQWGNRPVRRVMGQAPVLPRR